MADVKLYSAQDIEQLKQKIATYRDTLMTIKAGNSIDDYLFMKSELNGFKKQVSQLEEVMERIDDNRSVQVDEYEQQIEKFSRQMGSLNQTVEELNQDLSIVMKKLLNDRPEKSNDLGQVKDSVKTVNKGDENILIEETIQKNDQPPNTIIQSSNSLPSFKQLQSLVGKSIDSQDVTSAVVPSVSIGIQDNNLEQRPIPKHRFPTAGSYPNQIHNGLYRNVNRVTAIHFTNASKNQAISINENDHSAPTPATLPINEPEKNEKVRAYSDEVNVLAPVEEKKALIEEKESLVEEKEVLLEKKKYLKEEKEAPPLEIANDMKRQQHKNKELLFGFFRKKH